MVDNVKRYSVVTDNTFDNMSIKLKGKIMSKDIYTYVWRE